MWKTSPRAAWCASTGRQPSQHVTRRVESLRRGELVLDFGRELGDALRVRTIVVPADARCRPHIDARLAGKRPHADRHVGGKSHDQRTVDRIDMANANSPAGRRLLDDAPAAR